MSTKTALIEKREELKHRLEAGEYKTLVDVLFGWFSRMIQKITRNPQPISPWYLSLMIYLIIAVLELAFLFRTAEALRRLLTLLPPSTMPLFVFLGYYDLLLMVVGNLFVHRAFATFHDSVLDKIESVATLADFEEWLTNISNRKTHFWVSLVGGVLTGSYILYIYDITFGSSSFPINILVGGLFPLMAVYSFLYSLFYMTILSARIRRYSLKLYTADPGGSEVISHLGGLFRNLVYLIAIFAAVYIFITSFLGLLTMPSMVSIILFWWIPLITMFVSYQISLSNIIRRAKWKTLNEIQGKVEQLHSSENLGEKETMDTINRLMDYYDRIKSTRSSRIDLEAVLHLFNSLLLPLLALVLANLDKLIVLLPQRP